MSKNKKQNKNRKKGLNFGNSPYGGGYFNFMNIFWWIILVILGMNLLFQAITGMQVEEVPYSSFVSQVDAGQVESVEINQYDLTWTAETDGETQVYTTGKVNEIGRAHV